MANTDTQAKGSSDNVNNVNDVNDAPAIDNAPDSEDGQTICTSWHDKTYRSKLIYSVYITLAFGALGFCWGQRGPAFLDLQIVTNVDLKQGSAFFTSGSVGYLLGSLVSGILYDKLNKILLMFVLTFGMGLFTIILPFCSPYPLMVAMHLITGVFMGGLDTCGNAELVRTWGANGRSVMQTAHFCFGLSGVLSPLVTEPFITPLQTPNASWDGIGISNVTNVTTDVNYNVTTSPSPSEKPTTIIFYAFLITGLAAILTAIPFLVMHFKVRAQMKKRTAGQEEVPQKHEYSLPIFLVTMILICVMYVLYCCVEDSFSSYLMTFVVKGQGWSKSEGTVLTSVFWASFAFGRFCGIFCVKFISNVKLISICCSGLILSLIGFLVSAHFQANIGIWVGTVGAGLSMSVFFPTGLSWTEDELVKMTGRVSSAILISASTGTMINPIMLGYLMEAVTPMWYCYLLASQSVLCALVFLILLTFARTYLKKRRSSADITTNVAINTPPATVDQKFI